MKNGVFKIFVVVLILLSIVFFDYIEEFFLLLSDILYDGFGLKIDVVCILLAILFVALFAWFLIYFFKHQEKSELVEVVEFNCPNDMTPIELGFFVDGVVDSEDVSSLIVYWASKKYVEISGEKKNQKIKKLVDTLPKTCKQYEINFFNTIFKNDKEISIDTLSERASGSECVANMVKDVEQNVGEKFFSKSVIYARQAFLCGFVFLLWFAMMYFRLEYFLPSSTTLIVEIVDVVMVSLLVMTIDWHLKYYDYRHKNNKKKGKIFSLVVLCLLFLAVAAVSGFFYWDDFYQVIFIWLALALIFVAVFLAKKFQIYSKEGWEKLGNVMGFKQFLEVAEKDRIKMLVDENPNVFFDVLPYAYVLGVSDKWIKNMDVVSVEIEDKQLTKTVATVVLWQIFIGGFSPIHIVRSSLMRSMRNGGQGGFGGPKGPKGGGFGGGGRGGIGGIRRR